MRILFPGGAGLFGAFTARRLAASDLVDEITLAGRTPEVLERVAAEVGDKARTVTIDVRDEERFAALAADYDLIVNTAGPEWEVLLPALRATIAAGTHYCDIGAMAGVTKQQLALDTAARDRGVVAVLGIGFDPGQDNLLAVHASRQLDSVEDVQLRHHWLGPSYLREAAEFFRSKGHVDTSVRVILKILSEPAPVYREGGWEEVNPLDPIVVDLPGYGAVPAYPLGTAETVTLPRHVRARSVSTVLVSSPPAVSELLAQEARRVLAGVDPADAAKTFLQTVAADPDRWLAAADSAQSRAQWSQSVSVTGTKDGRAARYTCWPHGLPSSTSIPLTVAALRILRGDVSARGVLPPEACFEPTSFFQEAVGYGKEEDRDKRLLGERFEWLDEEGR